MRARTPIRGNSYSVSCGNRLGQGPLIPSRVDDDDLSSPRFYHGTKATLKPGDLIGPGYTSNYGKGKKAD